MPGIVLLRNIAALASNLRGSAFVAQTAGATAAVTGTTIDRVDANNGALASSALFSLFWTTVLSAAKTFSIGSVVVQHSPDGSTWSTYVTPTSPGLVATGAGTVNGVSNFAVDLTDAYRYVRVNWTPTLSNTSTDTVSALTVATLAAGDRAPT